VVVPYATIDSAIEIPDSLTAPAYGRVLTASVPTWDGLTDQPASDEVSYRWQLCSTASVSSCSSVSKVGPNYTVASSAIGKRVRLLVGVTVGSGANTTTAWDASPVSGVVTVTAKFTVAPAIVLGTGLTAPARWTQISVSASLAYRWQGATTYQWQACKTTETQSCVDIPGEKATHKEYAPSGTYAGKGIRAVVTYTGSDGTKVSAATPISLPIIK
jgi:hypothetical protein